MAEAGDLDIQAGQPSERCDCLLPRDIEGAENRPAVQRRDVVARDQNPFARQMDGDASRGMAGCVDYSVR